MLRSGCAGALFFPLYAQLKSDIANHAFENRKLVSLSAASLSTFAADCLTYPLIANCHTYPLVAAASSSPRMLLQKMRFQSTLVPFMFARLNTVSRWAVSFMLYDAVKRKKGSKGVVRNFENGFVSGTVASLVVRPITMLAVDMEARTGHSLIHRSTLEHLRAAMWSFSWRKTFRNASTVCLYEGVQFAVLLAFFEKLSAL